MRRTATASLLAALWLLPLAGAGADGAPGRASAAAPRPIGGPVEDFGPNLRNDCPFPEGVAVDPRGNVYASSFAFAPTAWICVLDRFGGLTGRLGVAAGPAGVASLLGMLLVPSEGLYLADFADGQPGHGRLLLVDVSTGAAEVVATGFTAPNAIARDAHGRLYVSDSFEGRVYRVDRRRGETVAWAESPLLRTTGQPPFGANGLAFDRTGRFLYVANTGDSAVLRVPVLRSGAAGPVETFARGGQATGFLWGADGIQFDVQGNLWVCANQANEVQVLSPSGALLARLSGAGAAALDFPASLVFRGRTLFVTNLSLGTGGVNSKVSELDAAWPGAPLRP
ncbi:MAG TPA: SMP-30/gluconolactonase/LRE family protein [Anaeromyxobacteraceae bacterium]|nr:SMP-30/gluconolactonase/LRE family protein [Anaeromyxobacteraceae bacterium]